MGCLLKWKPAAGASYDNVYIYRSATQTGTYAQIVVRPYTTYNYYDIDGTTTSWYKIRFYDSLLAKWSDYSDAWQGGTFRGYCNIQDIRDMTNLTSSQINDAQVCVLISRASERLNQEISVFIEEERLEYIDSTRCNKVDGTNYTYYTMRYPIGDITNSFTVSTSDIYVYQYDNTTTPVTKTQLNVTSLNPDTGMFTVDNTAIPVANMFLTVTYRYVPLSVSEPHPLIRQAAIFLTAALAYQKINVGKASTFRIGNTYVHRDMDSFKVYYQRYKELLLDINDRSMGDIKEAPNIPGLWTFERNQSRDYKNKNSQYTQP